MKSKIVSLEKLAKISQDFKKQGKKIVHCHGCFDLLHPGHIKHFEAAKKMGDVLVVTITPDKFIAKGPGRPAFNQELRLESLAALESVDYVALNKWESSIKAIKLIKPDFYVRGSDYLKRPKEMATNFFKENEAVKKIGGQVKFTHEITFSSSSLINQYYSPLSSKAKNFIEKFKKKHSAKKIIEKIRQLSTLKVLVVGETIIDEYVYCRAVGKPEKAAVVSAKYLYKELFAGGSLAVANHIAGFTEDVALLTCLGEKEQKKELIERKLRPNVNPIFIKLKNSPTPIKRRYLEKFGNQKMFEVAFVNDSPLDKTVEAKIISWLKKNLKKFDIVLVADFGHGMLTPKVIKTLEQKAKFLAVNAQTNSLNFGFNPITKYQNPDYVSIDERELRICFADKFTNIKKLIRRLSKLINCSQINITLGDSGTLYWQKGKFYSAPIFSGEIVDTLGAGDAFFAITSLLAQQEVPPLLVPFVGNCVGALAVKILGNKKPIEAKSLFKFIEGLLK